MRPPVRWYAAWEPQQRVIFGTGLSPEDALDEGRSVAATLGEQQEVIDRLAVARCSADLAEAHANGDARNLHWVVVETAPGATDCRQLLILTAQWHKMRAEVLPA